MANAQSPTKFVITPAAVVTGAPVDDYTVAFMAAPQAADGSNVVPTGFPASAPNVAVPAKDLTPDASGNVNVPIPDVVTSILSPGTYIAAAAANSSAAVNSGGVATESAFSSPVFFDIPKPTPPVPGVPGFAVA